MTTSLAENAFGKGRAALARGRYLEGLAYFEAASALARRAGAPAPMKYLSYYGLCLAMGTDRLPDAREICENALRRAPADPEIYLNLGRVYLVVRERGRAFETFVRGLKVDRRHRGLLGALKAIGFRRRPVLGFLARRHPINRLLGRLSAALRARDLPALWRPGPLPRST